MLWTALCFKCQKIHIESNRLRHEKVSNLVLSELFINRNDTKGLTGKAHIVWCWVNYLLVQFCVLSSHPVHPFVASPNIDLSYNHWLLIRRYNQQYPGRKIFSSAQKRFIDRKSEVRFGSSSKRGSRRSRCTRTLIFCSCMLSRSWNCIIIFTPVKQRWSSFRVGVTKDCDLKFVRKFNNRVCVV